MTRLNPKSWTKPTNTEPHLATPSLTPTNSSSASRSHPIVSIITMNATSPSMRERFKDFMPTQA
ncbi:hypothetical protein PIB30_034274 [Stylosanthes scabra]|uniref:Uncharacterized protein n=1 Tax=Stylosanthes scabra TaxID=79078 RepID=A0ABU6YEP1_9FABA|nr:hypothetical protein [Stylosanthes scabra]